MKGITDDKMQGGQEPFNMRIYWEFISERLDQGVGASNMRMYWQKCSEKHMIWGKDNKDRYLWQWILTPEDGTEDRYTCR